VFGVLAGKLLAFIIFESSIEANPKKMSTTMDMEPVKNLKGA